MCTLIYNKIAIVLLFAIIFVAPGCISMSKKEKEEHIASMPSVAKSIKESIDSSFFIEGAWPTNAWWEVFASKELTTLIEKALLLNPSLQAIEKRIQLAKEKAKVSRSKLYPFIFFDFNETWQHLSKNGLYKTLNPTIPVSADLLDLTLSFTYPFDFWFKYRNQYRAAIGQAKAAIAEAKEVELIVTTSVAQSYFALKANLLLERLYKNLIEVRLASLELQNLLFDKALLSILDPLAAEENLSRVRKELASVQDEIANNRHLVNTLVGVGPDEPFAIDDNFPPLDKIVIPSNISIDLLARRPDLMAQIWKVEALAHEVGVAKADFLPEINLGAFVGVESLSFAQLMQGKSLQEGLKPAIHLPLFTAGGILANVKAKKAAFEEAVYEYNSMILKSAKEVTDILAFGKSVFEKLKEQDKIIKSAKSRLDVTSLRQKMGLDSFLEVYVIQEEVLQKLIEEAYLIYDKFLAYIKLVKALGGGYEEAVPLEAPKRGENDS